MKYSQNHLVSPLLIFTKNLSIREFISEAYKYKIYIIGLSSGQLMDRREIIIITLSSFHRHTVIFYALYLLAFKSVYNNPLSGVKCNGYFVIIVGNL